MGAQVRFLPLLAGIGLNKISAAAPINHCKFKGGTVQSFDTSAR